MEASFQGETQASAAMSTLNGQLREIYGRAAYTQKTHEKMADNCTSKHQRIKRLEIVLSAVTSGSLLVAVFGDSRGSTIVGAVLSTILLGVTLYFKEASLAEQAQKHAMVGSKLWGVREALLSLLVDMQDGRVMEEVRNERDRLNGLLEEIYASTPRTDGAAYAAAQQALKQDEELFFSDRELNRMLPARLRTGAGSTSVKGGPAA
jgi:hypothetical protein